MSRQRCLVPSLVIGVAMLACGEKSDDDGHNVNGDVADTADGGGSVLDVDGDGFSSEGGDCDDADPNIGPTATDIVGDGVDQNCDGVDGTDADGDGHASVASGGDDCDDTDGAVNPLSEEIPYDGIDNDCEGSDLVDQDGDGYDGGEGGADCNDLDAAVNPGAVDEPYDGIDSDCGGDDDYDGDGDGVPVWDDCDDHDPTLFLGAAANEPTLCTRDSDGDGYGDMYTNGGADCDDSDPEQYAIAQEGRYIGSRTATGSSAPAEWEIELVGTTWTYASGRTGTVDEFGTVDSYSENGCVPTWGTCAAVGSVCGDRMEITITKVPLYSGTVVLHFEGTLAE